MKSEKEIIEKIDLCEILRDTTKAGYAKRFLINYDSSTLKKKYRLKEWDFYQISNDEYCLQMNISHITYLTTVSINLFNFKTGKKYSFGHIKPFRRNLVMESQAEANHNLKYECKNFVMEFVVRENTRKLTFTGSNKKYSSFKAEITLSSPKKSEAMTIVTPFKNKKNHFYLNYKNNSFTSSGYVLVNEEKVDFNNGYGLIDWGRGIWPYKNTWIWGSFTNYINNDLFSLNIGFGFGDTKNASENMAFINGKAYKLKEIKIERKDYLSTYYIYDDEKKVDLKMEAFYDNYTSTSIFIIYMKCHQVFGKLSGSIELDNKKYEINNIIGFIEECNNRW